MYNPVTQARLGTQDTDRQQHKAHTHITQKAKKKNNTDHTHTGGEPMCSRTL